MGSNSIKKNFEYCSSDEYEIEANFLHNRFSEAVSIPGTQQIHAVIPINNNEVATKMFSNSTESKIAKIRRRTK